MLLLRLLILGSISIMLPVMARGQTAPSNVSSNAIEKLLKDTFPASAPGAAVLVVSKGTVLLRKGFGQANLELGVPVDPAQIFRIGSMTKQFTAVAILQLAEAGKLSLDDDISKYVTDFPTGGQKVSILNLLTQTSGLLSYTDEKVWLATWRQDLSVNDILAFTRGKPLKFPPGTDWDYSNTNYILLGAIIEKVSGQSYADYVQEYIFKPAEMTHTLYDSTERVIPGRIPGYSPAGPQKWNNAAYLSMSHPYAAGALLSSVDDLWKWEKALAAGKLVSAKSLAAAYENHLLNDGRATGYGYGWSIGRVQELSTVEHGGGINGFITYEMRVPKAELYIAILCNNEGAAESVGTGTLAFQIAKMVIGESGTKPVTVEPAALKDFVGVYRAKSGNKRAITVEDGKLAKQRTGDDKPVPLTPVSQTEFEVPDVGARYLFTRDANGRVNTLVMQPRAGMAEVCSRTDEPFEEPAVPVEVPALERCVGNYELGPNSVLIVTRQENGLRAEMSGGAKVQLIAESPTRYRVPAMSSVIEFKVAGDGPATSLVVKQGATETLAKRVK